jgi:hypothetical protein
MAGDPEAWRRDPTQQLVQGRRPLYTESLEDTAKHYAGGGYALKTIKNEARLQIARSGKVGNKTIDRLRAGGVDIPAFLRENGVNPDEDDV